MKERKNSNLRENMLDYRMAWFGDVNDFSWDVAKASFAEWRKMC